MPTTVWLASALVAAALPLLYWSFNQGNEVSARAVQNLGTRRNQNLRVAQLERPAIERLGLPVVSAIGRLGRGLLPVQWVRRYDQDLGRAGKLGQWTAEQIVGIKIVFLVVSGLYAIVQVISSPSLTRIAIAVGCVAFMFFVPDLLLKSMADRRHDLIQNALPDVLDQLTMSVEAGLGFESAIARISERENHPLAQELGRMIQDIRLGTPRADAMASLSQRAHVEDLKHVVLSLRQSEKLGVPLAKTLRVQAEEMRTKRKFRAEEKAHKLPVKMIFPLGLCILPALFIVILGPAAIQLSRVF
ncbi:MAG: type II secretion system F family protein [Acidimicrobiales bacterium]|nr:type II secretion system F family protein [Acidimicrobiales bacterium]